MSIFSGTIDALFPIHWGVIPPFAGRIKEVPTVVKKYPASLQINRWAAD
jgi:hypothetical protein